MGEATTTVRVPQRAWAGDVEAELAFPDGWQVVACPMRGHQAARLTDEGFRQAFAKPIGCPPIRELARGKRRVVIVFDDLARPTKTYQIVPYVLEELAAAGVDEEGIQFLCALGCHGAHTAADFRQKLGADVVARFSVYNHNPFANCVAVGTTARGTPVRLNAEFVAADLRVGIGAILPHGLVGFGGGGKIVLPGIAAIETIQHNHVVVPRDARAAGVETGRGMGRTDGNAMLLDIQEACRLGGLDVKIDALVNGRRDTAALFVGEPMAVFAEGVERARAHYLSRRAQGAQVAVANAYGKAYETGLALGAARGLLPPEGGTAVLLTANPRGALRHYLWGPFGDHTDGRGRPTGLPRRVNRLIIQAPWPDKVGLRGLAPPGAASVVGTWDEVLGLLRAEHPGGARVAVIPDGTVQYFA